MTTFDQPVRAPAIALTTRRIGIAGIILGLAAFWIALPPLTVRSIVWPLLVALAALAAGIWAVSHGERRIGYGAIVSAVFGVALGYFATRTSLGHLNIVIVWSAILAAISSSHCRPRPGSIRSFSAAPTTR